MSVSILIVDDEPDVAHLFRQRFQRESRQGTYVLYFAASGEEALDKLAHGVWPELIVISATTPFGSLPRCYAMADRGKFLFRLSGAEVLRRTRIV